MSIITIFAVGLGGFIGSILRYLTFIGLKPFFNKAPYETIIVNVLGCFIIGILTAILELKYNLSYNIRAFLFTGLLGGYTTFSTFAVDFGKLVSKGNIALAIWYASLSIVLSLLFFFFALYLVNKFLRP